MLNEEGDDTALPIHGADADNPCAGRWKNMNDDLLKRIESLHEETGIFLCLCRHGFVLLICDMIKSGEL